MFGFVAFILRIIFGYENWWTLPWAFVVFSSPLLLPFAFVIDVIFEFLYVITGIYFDIF